MARKRGWVVVELSSQGEKKIKEIPSVLKEILNTADTEVFVPVFWLENSVCDEKVYLFDGYVFCKSNCSNEKFFAIEDDAHFKSILTHTQNGLRIIEFVPESKIKSLKKQLVKLTTKNLEEGDFVEIMDGTCKALRGTLINKENQIALVLVDDLRSTELLIEVPLASLQKALKKKSFFDYFKDFEFIKPH